MPFDSRHRVFSVIVFGCIVAAASASSAQNPSPHPTSSAADSQAKAELSRVIAGVLSDTSPQMRMGPTRMATTADSARAAAIVLAARAGLSQYVDVKVAERDGYYRNNPSLEEQPIYHYNRLDRLQTINAAEQGAFDPTKPVSILYKKDDRGQLRLIGAMYAAGASAAPEELDALLPISMAQWHEHVNLCYPGGPAVRYAPKKVDAGVVFFSKLFFSITSAKECETAGGRFVPIEGGWMAHVYMFAGSDDPTVIWGADDVGNMDAHMAHPPASPKSSKEL
jgi:hypothetical protein